MATKQQIHELNAAIDGAILITGRIQSAGADRLAAALVRCDEALSHAKKAAMDAEAAFAALQPSLTRVESNGGR